MCPRWIKAMLPKEPKTMRPLKSHLPADACPTLTTLLQQTQEARVFRRAHAVREVVVGSHVNAVSATFHGINAALRKWGQRLAQHGPQGLRDRPRPGRPRKRTRALEQPLTCLVEQDLLPQGSLYAQWRCRARARG